MMDLTASSAHGFLSGPSCGGQTGHIEILHVLPSIGNIPPGEISELGWDVTIGPLALQWTLDQVEKSLPDEPEDDRATVHAVSLAIRCLGEVGNETKQLTAATKIESFEGDLILHWDFSNKSLALVFPALDNKPVKLYREVLADNRAVSSNLFTDPSPALVARVLEWLITE